MGIHDRHYVRDQNGPRGGAGGLGGLRSVRMWSANTWIIAICVAVFVVDGMIPVRPVPLDKIESAVKDFGSIDPEALIVGQDVVTEAKGRTPVRGFRPVYVTGPQGPVEVGRYHLIYMHPIESWLHFSTRRGFLDVQFWRFIGFQFLHSHAMLAHVVFNMIGLFFFGPMVEQYLGSKRYVAFYLLCGIFGALLYMLLNLGGAVADQIFDASRVPGLLFNDMATPLIGASAGVFGVIMAGAYLAPNSTVLLFFILPMKLRTVAYVLVGVAALTVLGILGGTNAGGEAGHLGGAIAGFYFIRRPHHLHGFFDILGRVDPTSHHYRKGGGKRQAGGQGKIAARFRAKPGGRGRGGDDAEVDRILNKVHTEGLASLSEREKRILREASER